LGQNNPRLIFLLLASCTQQVAEGTGQQLFTIKLRRWFEILGVIG
jgi:hypothetical protein